MDDKGKPRKKAGAIVALVLLLIVPVLYVLSYGPAWGLLIEERLSEEIFYMFYAPLRLACAICTPFENFIKWYVAWCNPGFSI